MKRIFSTILISGVLLFGGKLFSQNAKNAFYVELGGSGGIYSLNYERQAISKGNMQLFGRVGFSNYAAKEFNADTAIVRTYSVSPFLLGLTAALGAGDHKVDIGICFRRDGLSVTTGDEFPEDTKRTAIVPSLGYRYQPAKGFFAKAGIAVSTWHYDVGATLRPQVAVGTSF